MARFESYPEGIFSWVDLLAKDQAAAKALYGELFGWTAVDNPTPDGGAYTMFQSRGAEVAGLGEMSEELASTGMPSVWNSYVSVRDADATVAKAEGLGAKVEMPVMQVMDAGRMAILADPGGARLSVWEAGEHIGATLANEPVSFCWNERITRDVNGAKRFYQGLFGWEFEEADEGYQMIRHADRINGGLLPYRDEMGPMPDCWTVYFAVDDCDASVETLERLGGQLLNGPIDIEPGRFAVVMDPQGAVFHVMKLSTPD